MFEKSIQYFPEFAFFLETNLLAQFFLRLECAYMAAAYCKITSEVKRHL